MASRMPADALPRRKILIGRMAGSLSKVVFVPLVGALRPDA
jgi:hypothetical protein